MLIDATRPWPATPLQSPFPPTPRKEIMEDALKLAGASCSCRRSIRRPPWYGYELGWWSEAEIPRQAGRLAVQGRYYETGEKMKQARVPVKGIDQA